MSRLRTAPAVDAAPTAAQPLLAAVQAKLGVVPNMFRAIASSPAALAGYLGLEGALTKDSLGARSRERIALAVAEVNQCGYCLAAHAYLGKNLAKLDVAEIDRNRAGGSADLKADAAVRFAVHVAQKRGQVTDADLAAVKAAGFDDGAVIEIVLQVALNTLTNYVNLVAGTDIDFPRVEALKAA
jgi:uncharacterized peroxidase-related enzyme